ncbi:hypothetical protein R8510_04951 [Ralstonia chuxiongensis]|nr:hypothetical protein R8510_04951 [Ralstonia chuxiongensis]
MRSGVFRQVAPERLRHRANRAGTQSRGNDPSLVVMVVKGINRAPE